MTDSLTTAFSRSAVKLLADPRSFARGLLYAVEGRVEELTAAEDRLAATVRGSLPYEVELWVDGGEPGWSCTCPVGEDAEFCKHCVAAALAEVTDPLAPETLADAEPEQEPRERERGGEHADDAASLRDYVLGLDHERLAALVLQQAADDWRLAERLRAEAAAAAGSPTDLRVWRRRLESAFATSDFVEYAEAATWANDVNVTLDALEDLAAAGHPDAVVALTEHAHRLAEAAIDEVDDSDGWLTGIAERLGELHLQACTEARPDPVGLARRLVELELNAELDTYYRAAAAYAGVLGEEGIGEYRRLVEPRFEELAAGDDGGFSTERFRLTQAMIGVAMASGDPDQLIAVKQRSLRMPDDYREVASMLAATGRIAEAVDWAQRGLAAFPNRPWQTPPLRELLAGLHRQAGRTEEAVRVFWDGFGLAPSLEAYRRLIQEAEAAGDAAAWRERALDDLRDRLKWGTSPEAGPPGSGTPGATSPSGVPYPLHRQGARHRGSTLAEILLYENEVDEAWQVASAHGCDQRLWLTLARAREGTHPEDAIPVYQREIASLIGMKKTPLYHQAVELMVRVERLYRALGRPEAFTAYVAELRAEHRRKRNLMALLDARRW